MVAAVHREEAERTQQLLADAQADARRHVSFLANRLLCVDLYAKCYACSVSIQQTQAFLFLAALCKPEIKIMQIPTCWS